MKRLLPTTGLLLSFVIINSQDYQTVFSGRTAFFKNQDANVHSLRIDSIKFDQDSILYPMRTILPTLEDYCFSPTKSSWIGDRIIIKENGDNLFFNWQGDTILIKTQAKVLESWVMYQNKHLNTGAGNAYSKVVCTVTNVDTLSILGVLDSVKTISLQYYDKDMAPINNKKANILSLSKKFGFVKLIPFYFVNNNSYYTNSFFSENFQLVGLTNPTLGLQNLSWFQVYDFQVDDEIHIKSRSGVSLGDDALHPFTSKKSKKYLSRTNYADSIVYIVEMELSVDRSDDFSYIKDTIREVIHTNNNFDMLPGEVYYENSYFASSYSMHHKDRLSKFDDNLGFSVSSEDDDCWTFPIADGCFPALEYFEGLGGTYYNCEGMWSYSSRELVYYKKGSDIWGTPMVISAIDKTKSGPIVHVYPNPAKDQFKLKAPLQDYPIWFELFNINGKTMQKKQLFTADEMIDIRGCQSGIYLYKVRNKDAKFGYGKLIVE